MKAIFTRRSIRKFTSEPVPEDQVQELLKAAMAAPSAGNQQPWQFIVINERKILDQILNIHPYAAMIKESPLAILVCGDLQKENLKGYWHIDCSAATQNILIAVADMGLGAVWLGVYPREERIKGLSDLLQTPEHIIPFALIPVGHPAEQKPPSDRYDESRIHYNKW